MINTAQAKCKRVLRWLRNEEMSTEIIGGNPAVTQAGTPVATGPATTALAIPGSKSIALTNAPDFMKGLAPSELGTELMGQYISPPRMKLVQSQSGQELRQQFPESSIIAVPALKEISAPIDFKNGMKESQSIRVVPLFFYPEFVLMSPFGIDPFLRERSTDPQSPLAAKCRALPFEKRSIPCPEDPNQVCKYKEVMNFIVAVLHPHGFEDPLLISFSGSAFTEARNWCKLAKVPRGIPLYGQVFDLSCSPRKKDKFNWYGWNVRAATAENGLLEFITDEPFFNWLRDQHTMFAEGYADGLLQANYEDADDLGESAVNTTATASDDVAF